MLRLLPISVQDLLHGWQPALHRPSVRGASGLKPGLIHLFRASGQGLLLCGATGALVRLDEPGFRSWQDYLAGAAPPPPSRGDLESWGLFRAPGYPDQASMALPEGLHSLCLNVAHDCDLSCGYCFAGAGRYGGPGGLMSLTVAEQALELLLASAPAGRTVSVDFFGGEPLLAWEVVTGAVAYGRARAAATGRAITFTLTTNGQQMDDDRASFCAREMSTVIVSIDGRPEVHDRWRTGRGGQGSYQAAVAAAARLRAALGERTGGKAGGGAGSLWIRGTYTRDNLDFWRDVEHLAGLGFDQVSMEPVSAAPDHGGSLSLRDLPRIRESYDRIAELVAAGKVRFFHFDLNLSAAVCAPKRYSGCGAGAGYACVNPEGWLYPCHQFDGLAGWEQGRIGELDRYRPEPRLAAAHVGAKPACRDCWAQLYCGGGCHWAAYRHGGQVLEPDPLACGIMRTRLEVALGLEAGPAGRPGRSRPDRAPARAAGRPEDRCGEGETPALGLRSSR